MPIWDLKRNEPSDEGLARRLSQFLPPSSPMAPSPALDGGQPLDGPGAPSPEEELIRDALPMALSDEWATPTVATMDSVTAAAPRAGTAARPPFLPRRPETLEEAGLSAPFVSDLILRTLHQANELTGSALAERVALPFAPIVLPVLEGLRRDQAVEVKGQRGLGDAGYVYAITEKGVLRAQEAREKLQYTGPAPVPLEHYTNAVLAQTVRDVVVTHDTIQQAFHDLIISDEVLEQVGPAVNSGSSIFLFGNPGNGKTSIAERITAMLGDPIFVPHAVEVDGAVIKVFDAVVHRPVEEPGRGRPDWDPRWVKVARPVVIVGGELTMSSLDLLYHEMGKYYEAPLQMKANDGMLLIDDFGRQLIRPQDLLNRWIVPLEKRVDYLSFLTGKKIAIPFEQLIVFSTNLDPRDLVDDAFLRRIKFKINVTDPEEGQFRETFRRVCERRGVPYDEGMFQYLLDSHYRSVGRPLRMCQPRDLIEQIIAIAKYKMVPAELTQPLIDRACETYFVDLAG